MSEIQDVQSMMAARQKPNEFICHILRLMESEDLRLVGARSFRSEFGFTGPTATKHKKIPVQGPDVLDMLALKLIAKVPPEEGSRLLICELTETGRKYGRES